MAMSIKAIFFDNDGVLVSTERLFFESNQQMIQQYGSGLTSERYQQLVMVEGKGTWDILSGLGLDETAIKRAQEYRDQCYFELLDNRDFNINYVEDVLKELSKLYRLIIVSASRRHHFEAIHQKTGFLKYFEKTFCREDYPKQKPAPDGFLAALDYAKCTPKEVVAIDDSPRGIRAAHLAGLKTIALPHDLTIGMNFPEADFHLDQIVALPALLKSLNKQ